MRPSNVFVAGIFLVALGTMLLFGIATLVPKAGPTADGTGTKQGLTPLDRPRVDFGNPARGADSPALTIVEFGDHR